MHINKSNSGLTGNMVFTACGWVFHARHERTGDFPIFSQVLGFGKAPLCYKHIKKGAAFDHNHWFSGPGSDVKMLLSFVADFSKLRSRQIKRARKALRRKEARKNG